MTTTTLAPPRRTRTRLATIDYRHPDHVNYPHVVKFSGGRSSATLAFELAEAGLLKPGRGDVVLFANTSAEHPGTYEFAKRCKKRLEEEFNLPCFWFEFCTVEDAVRGEYRRKSSYRLVQQVPRRFPKTGSLNGLKQSKSKTANGYHSGGEVFEEFLSFQGILPSPQQRSCTAKLKLWPSHLLLAEWFGQSDGPMHAGHHRGEPYLTSEAVTDRYLEQGGTAEREDHLGRIRYSIGRPHNRPAQKWADYTKAKIIKWVEAAPFGRRYLWGRNAQPHVTLLGLRADEQTRVNRVLGRTMFSEGATRGACEVRTQPPGEHPYFPLYDAGTDAEGVREYWDREENRNQDLEIPDWAGNCTFCFMKGTRRIELASRKHVPKAELEKPSDISWWIGMEEKYRRVVPARSRNGISGNGDSTFGFMGVSGPSYREIAEGNAGARFATGTPSCDCTD